MAASRESRAKSHEDDRTTKAREVMTRDPVRCRPATDIRTAARMMWDGDFGILPVVDDDDEVVGLVTDRDIAMAVGTQPKPPHQTMVYEIMNPSVVTCAADDNVTTVLELMREHQIRRLPVIQRGKLLGLVSLNDLVVSGEGIPAERITETLRAVSRHRGIPVNA